MSNLRTGFAEVMQDYGHWVLLRKALLTQKCSCIDPATDEPRDNCNRCNGAGHPFVDHIIKARRTKLVNSVEMSTDVGFAAASTWHFYMMYNTKPSKEDWVLEIAIDATTNEPIIPYDIKRFYDIQDIEVMRGEGGEVVYYDCHCEESIWNVLS